MERDVGFKRRRDKLDEKGISRSTTDRENLSSNCSHPKVGLGRGQRFGHFEIVIHVREAYYILQIYYCNFVI